MENNRQLFEVRHFDIAIYNVGSDTHSHKWSKWPIDRFLCVAHKIYFWEN